MNSFDRGIIKWRPFESVAPSYKIINEILSEKSKIPLPYLSDEQIKDIEHKLVLAFYTKDNIEITYFEKGCLIKINSNIKKIDSINHKIYFQNNTILFEQIINITI